MRTDAPTSVPKLCSPRPLVEERWAAGKRSTPSVDEQIIDERWRERIGGPLSQNASLQAMSSMDALHCFGTVLCWSRRKRWWFATSIDRPHTLEGLTGWFEDLHGVPAIGRTDRMGQHRRAIDDASTAPVCGPTTASFDAGGAFFGLLRRAALT